MHNDLNKMVGVRALVFQDTPLLTAISNDHGYELAYDRPLEVWADAGDLLVAVSSSGRSESILKPVRSAAARGCRVLTLSGFQPDNPLRGLGDWNFYVPSSIYGFVEIAHQTLTHCMTDSAVHVQYKGAPPPGFA
jgi:D-sedoheptulose 7-phosphate isomerase